MYSSNSRLSVMVRSWSASMLPYCSSVSRLAKQFRKSISQLASASLRFLRIRHAMYLSSTDSAGCRVLGGSLRMRSYTFCTSALILTLFCFMRNSRKAISVAISESCCLLPLISLKTLWRSCRLLMKLCRLLMRQASSSDTSIILASSPPSNTARKCFSAPSTSTSVCASACSSRISSTQRQSSSKGTFPAGSTSVGVSMTSLREGTSSSSMAARSSFSCWSMWRLQQVSISSRQNFSRRICFCTSFSKTPNCGERRRDEKMDYFFSRGAGSLGRLRGLGLLRMGCVRLTEWRDSDYSPELFYSPSRFSKDIQNYYQPHQLPPPHLPAFAPLIYYLMGRAAKKEKTPSEHSEEEQEDQDYDEEDEDAILQGHPEDELDENQRNEELLAAIQEKAAECPENEELSWNAIYSLKKEEAALSAAMAEELETIREKYELLKQPIYKLISNVALGNKVDAKLYRPEGLPCRGDPNKVQPIAIPNFWAQVFDKEGLISHNVDVECLGKLKEFSCQLIEPKTNHIRILMKFKAATEYFSNLELQVDTHHDPATNEPTRDIKQDIKYKKDREESSIFTILFDPKTAVQETYNYCSELYQDYTNAIYFYFREEEDYENGEGEDDEEGEEEEEEDSEEVEAVKKPIKKSKGEQPKKELEKPECKQQ